MITGLVVLVPVGKDFDKTEKTPTHLSGYMIHSRPRVWKRLRHVVFHRASDSDHKRGRCEQNHDGFIPSHERTGVG